MNIHYQNITIRNATSQDAATLCSWWNDGSIMAHAGFPNGINTTIEKIQKSLLTDDDAIHRRHIIEYDSKPIGETNYRNLGGGIAELGIKICVTSMQSKGLGTIILSLIIRHLFESLHYQKVVLDTNMKNIRAQRTYTKLGFKQVRIRHNDWIDQLGVAQSSIDYSLTHEDFIDHSQKT